MNRDPREAETRQNAGRVHPCCIIPLESKTITNSGQRKPGLMGWQEEQGQVCMKWAEGLKPYTLKVVLCFPSLFCFHKDLMNIQKDKKTKHCDNLNIQIVESMCLTISSGLSVLQEPLTVTLLFTEQGACHKDKTLAQSHCHWRSSPWSLFLTLELWSPTHCLLGLSL